MVTALGIPVVEVLRASSREVTTNRTLRPFSNTSALMITRRSCSQELASYCPSSSSRTVSPVSVRCSCACSVNGAVMAFKRSFAPKPMV